MPDRVGTLRGWTVMRCRRFHENRYLTVGLFKMRQRQSLAGC